MITSAKAFPNLDLQNKKYIDTLGVVCGTLLRLPTSAVLYMSHGQIYESSGGVIKTGRNSGTLLAMKTLATDHLDKADNDRAKKVKEQLTCKVRSRTRFTGSFYTSTGVDETVPSSEHPTVPWCRYDGEVSLFPRL